MRILPAVLALSTLGAAVAPPVLAQTPPATIGQQYVPAPWWMRDPVIASIGQVRVEITANRAGFNASFQAIDRSAAEASRKAADQVRALSQTLAGYGADKVRVETTLNTRPLYEQYRDEAGNLRDNIRPDKIQRYQTEASVRLTVRDIAVLERVYATVVATQPTSISPVWFTLEPENSWKANLAAEAMKDARRRAEAAAVNAGAQLGSVRVIDPTGRACQTDVLAGWPSYSAAGGQQTTVDGEVVTGSRMEAMMAPPPPPPAPPPPPPAPGQPPSETQIEAARLALQPPLQVLTDSACVVYGLR
ncbi:MAG: SIMPL domain-containing protein [Brevundimonas sp.]|uniref:SIMPL domain-containing protein n=1 Tax=Brevundimonas sp. TaxID=1871086 RepID=UPI0040338323